MTGTEPRSKGKRRTQRAQQPESVIKAGIRQQADHWVEQEGYEALQERD